MFQQEERGDKNTHFCTDPLYHSNLEPPLPTGVVLRERRAQWNPLNSEKNEIRHYTTLTWPQDAGDTISEDLNFKGFLRVDAPGARLQVTHETREKCLQCVRTFKMF